MKFSLLSLSLPLCHFIQSQPIGWERESENEKEKKRHLCDTACYRFSPHEENIQTSRAKGKAECPTKETCILNGNDGKTFATLLHIQLNMHGTAIYRL